MMTEEGARRILASKGSEASNPNYYSTQRVEGGWVFNWIDKGEPIPMGTRSEVVTDSGKDGRLKIGETAEQAIERLSASTD